jgi:glycopeptide antibiotics resistance protein
MILSFFLLGLCLALVMSRYRAFSIFVIPLCLFFALARVLPIDDLIFVTVGMIWAGYTGYLMLENDYLKIDTISYKRRIKKLEKNSQNEEE